MMRGGIGLLLKLLRKRLSLRGGGGGPGARKWEDMNMKWEDANFKWEEA